MISKLSLIAMAAATLAACNNEPIVGKDTPDPMADALANAAPVELPPAIAASKTYRCKDNSLVTIDWLQGGKGANLRIGDATTPVQLRASPAAEGEGANAVASASAGLVADGGYALSGETTANSVALTLPGKGKLTSHV
jgi:predicted small secreted protein